MMQLQIEGTHPQLVWLRKPTYLIGRSAACNIRIADMDLRPVHVCLKVEGDSVRLLRHEDAPVRINGQALESEACLSPGDRIMLGNSSLRLLASTQEHDMKEGHTVVRPADPKERRSAWSLHGVSPVVAGRAFEIRGSAVAGRATGCDIRLSEAHLSRRHARFTLTDRGLELEDLDSANGTYVNGRRITHAVLKGGDEVGLDKLKFRVQSNGADSDAATQAEADAVETRAPSAEAQARAQVHQAPRPPSGPTAIELQQARLRELRDCRAQEATAGPGSSNARTGSWLTLTVAVIAVAGMLWGATSFFETSFAG